MLEDDCIAAEDIQPLTEHALSHITSNNTELKINGNIEDNVIEIDGNNLSDVKFMSLMEEVSLLLGKNDLFKRSLNLIRGWWIYETASYVNMQTSDIMTDQVLCVLLCSIFNQHHAILFQPLQVFSIFLSEYCELDWSNTAVTLQGVVPFRPAQKIELTGSSLGSELTESLVTSPSSETLEPWLRHPTVEDLLSSVVMQKYTETSKTTKSTIVANIASGTIGSKSPVGGLVSTLCTGTPSPSPLSLPYLSPLSPYQDLDMNPMQFTLQSIDSVADSTTIDSSRLGSAQTPSVMSLSVPEGSDGQDTPLRKASVVVIDETFRKCAINIVHPLTNLNMITSTVSPAKASMIQMIFETGGRNLSIALKVSQGENASIQTPFNRFFKGILMRFRDNWQPDIFRGAQSMFQYSGGKKICHSIKISGISGPFIFSSLISAILLFLFFPLLALPFLNVVSFYLF